MTIIQDMLIQRKQTPRITSLMAVVATLETSWKKETGLRTVGAAAAVDGHGGTEARSVLFFSLRNGEDTGEGVRSMKYLAVLWGEKAEAAEEAEGGWPLSSSGNSTADKETKNLRE